MHQQVLYGVRDNKLRAFLFVVLHANPDTARRWYRDLKAKEPFKTHPEDYSLWRLGSMNLETGVVTGSAPFEVSEVSEPVDLKLEA